MGKSTTFCRNYSKQSCSGCVINENLGALLRKRKKAAVIAFQGRRGGVGRLAR